MNDPHIDEELARRQADAKLRERIKRIFSTESKIRDDAHDALKEAWSFDEPSFRLDEIALNPQSAALSAMRRDTIKEVITWLTKI